MVHARTIGKQTFTFIVSGKLWRNSLIMQDKETGSLWSHISGEALDGPMKGQSLNMLPSVQTTWTHWVEQHPDTKILRKEQEIRSSRYESYFKDPTRIGIFRTRWLMNRMPGKTLVHGITRRPHSLAIPDEKLIPDQVLNVQVGDDPLVVIRAADGGSRAYVSRAGGQTLHFQRAGQAHAIQDKETGSTWDLDKGLCISGKLRGAALEEVTVRLAFWFAWSSFYPNTEVVN